jgi:hypothetical protein
MDDLLNAYFTVDRLGPVLALLAVVCIFAAVRHTERIKPENKADG